MSLADLNLLFFGTPEFAAVILRSVQTWARVRAVVTQPDRPRGRKGSPLPSPVKLLAASAGIPVLQPDRASDPLFLQSLGNLRPDIILTAAYGQILPKTLLDLPRHGCVNVHASLLPRYRGAAPINWAVINGEEETGISIMLMEQGLDTGPVLRQEPVSISSDDTSVTLTGKLIQKAVDMLPGCLEAHVDGRLLPVPQDPNQATVAPMLRKADGIIDWSAPAEAIRNRVRGLLPWPTAHTYLGPLQLKILGCDIVDGTGEPGTVADVDKARLVVATGQEALSITSLQPAGRNVMPVRAFLQGHAVEPGDRFGQEPLQP